MSKADVRQADDYCDDQNHKCKHGCRSRKAWRKKVKVDFFFKCEHKYLKTWQTQQCPVDGAIYQNERWKRTEARRGRGWELLPLGLQLQNESSYPVWMAGRRSTCYTCLPGVSAACTSALHTRDTQTRRANPTLCWEASGQKSRNAPVGNSPKGTMIGQVML